MKPQMLTVHEAADMLGIKPATVRAWILRRQKLAVVKVGRAVRIPASSVQKFIDDNTIPPQRKAG
ncbi:MAG TPA: helix-turn-helix domain-containing protein [Terriglobales bacterium]|nr:helix-turn-helix domain-containing protein [Terriglobales bacterium]